MYDIRKLQLRLLDILREVDTVCRANDLRYYIWAGTLLGAKRHGGFIPWDDDIDIAMPRADYEVFVSKWRDLPQHLEFISMETDPKHQFPFGKVQDTRTTLIERKHMGYIGGIYLDVFPIDNIPAPGLRRRWLLMRYGLYKRLLYFVVRNPYKHGRGPRSWFPLLVRKIFSLQGLQRKLKKVSTEYESARTGYLVDYDSGGKAAMPAEWMGEPKPIVFDGFATFQPAEAHKYLTQVYGDYMTLPPANKRKQHLFYYLDLDRPYKDNTEAQSKL